MTSYPTHIISYMRYTNYIFTNIYLLVFICFILKYHDLNGVSHALVERKQELTRLLFSKFIRPP